MAGMPACGFRQELPSSMQVVLPNRVRPVHRGFSWCDCDFRTWMRGLPRGTDWPV